MAEQLTAKGYSNLRGKAAMKTLAMKGKRRTTKQRRRVYVYGLRGDINTHVVEALLATQVQYNVNAGNGFQVLGGGATNPALQFIFGGTNVTSILGSASVNWLFDNASKYLSIYDQYRMVKVEMEILFGANAFNPAPIGGGSSYASLPVIYAVIDYDDSTALTSVNNALDYSSCKTIQLGANTNYNGKQYMYLNRPTVQIYTNTSGTGSQIGELKVSPWLDSDSSNISHYGIKMYMSPDQFQTGDVVGTVTFNIRAHMQYKNIK